MNITTVSSGNAAYPLDVESEASALPAEEANPATATAQNLLAPRDSENVNSLKDGEDGPLPAADVVEQSQALATLKTLERMDPADISTDALEFMKIFQECGLLIRLTERELRATELSAQVGALLSAADAMKESADKRLAAGIAQGVMGIVGGAMQIGGGVLQIRASAKAFDASNKSLESSAGAKTSAEKSAELSASGDAPGAKNHADESARLGLESAKQNAQAMAYGSNAQAYGQIGAGASAVANAMGGIISSAYSHESELETVRKTRLEADAKVHETGVQYANEMMQSALEIIQSMKEKSAAIVQAQSDANRGIARNI